MKRIISIILAVGIIFSMLSSLCVLSSAEGFTKAEQKALEVTAALELFHPTEGDLSGNSTPIMRSELATVAVQMMGFTNPGKGDSGFPDVPSEHWASGWIRLAKSNGLMLGDEQGNFMPDMNVTYEQVLKVLVYMLGYAPKAEMYGGYPNGYIQTATELGLTKNLPMKKGMALTRNETAIAVYNALHADYLYQVGFSNQEMTYVTGDEYTILSQLMKVEYGTGILYEYGNNSAVKNSKYNNTGYCRIGNKGFTCSDRRYADYLGYEVEYYSRITEDESEGEVLYISPTKKNTDITVEIRDVHYTDSNMSLERFVYEENATEKTKTLKVDKDAAYVVNGLYDFSFEVDDFGVENGFVKLVDNDNDTVYDVVFVWIYENYVIENVNGTLISGKYYKSLDMNKYVDKEVEISFPSGERTGISGLSKLHTWDVISVAISSNDEFVKIFVTQDGISGQVESIENDVVIISGESRYISGGFNSTAKQSGDSYVQLGLNGEFYFDVVGNIAAVLEVADSGQKERYGYLLGMSTLEENGGMLFGTSEAMQVKLFTDSGTIEFVETEVRIRNKRTGKKDFASEILSETDFVQDNKTVHQLIQYRCNAEGKIIELSTAAETNGNEALGQPYYDFDKFSLDYSNGTNPFIYRRYSSAFGAKNTGFNPNFRVNANSKIFYIPITDSRVAQEQLKLFSLDSFEDYNMNYTNLYFYDSDDTGVCSALVYKEEIRNGSASTTSIGTDFFAVTKVVNTINEDNEKIVSVEGYMSGNIKNYELLNIASEAIIPNMILGVQTDLKGRLVVSDENIIYSPRRPNERWYKKIIKGGDPQPEVWTSCGTVERKNGKYFTVDFGTGLARPFYISQDFRLYKIEGGKFVMGNENDIVKTSIDGRVSGSTVVMNNRYDYVREIFIIDNN